MSIAWLIAIVLIIVGFIGIVMPGLPGIGLMFGGMWLAAWSEHFARVGVATVVVLGILAVVSYGTEFAAAAAGVKRVGASKRAIIGSALGTIIGVFFGLPGVIVGPFAGAVIGELMAHADLVRAGRVGFAAWLGFLIGAVIKVGIAFIMLGIFIVSLLVP